MAALLATMLIAAASPAAVHGQDADEDPVKLVNFNWLLAEVSNHLTKILLEEHLGISASIEPEGGISTVAGFQGLASGELDLAAEVVMPNLKPMLDDAQADGAVEAVGPFYAGGWQGWAVPTYVIKGDAERGIEASCPDLVSITDLNACVDVFERPDNPGMGEFIDGPDGWTSTERNVARIANYGLDFAQVRAGSEDSMLALLDARYQRGEPIVIWLNTPYWVFAAYDLTQLDEPACAADQDAQLGDACGLPPIEVLLAYNKSLEERYPAVVELLGNMEISMDAMNEMSRLSVIEKMSAEEAVRVWMAANEPTWRSWLPS
jgi:glycine betaine/proline transport system substrate-binding protein